MDDVQNTGVQETQVERETTTTSPGGEETTQTEVESTSGSETTEIDGSAAKTVPYDRFKEVNDRYRQTEEELRAIRQEIGQLRTTQPQAPVDPQAEQVKQALRQHGFIPANEVEQMVEQKVRRSQEDMQTEQTLSRLEKSYNGKDGRPRFDRRQVLEYAISRNIADPEVAYKALNESHIINWHIQQASKKSTGVPTEKSTGTGGQKAGPGSDDLLKAAQGGDSGAFDAYLKRTNVFKHMFGK